MTLTVEDGNGVSDADSFVTAAEALTIEASYYGSATVADDATREAALRRSWVYLSALEWQADTFPLFGGDIPQSVKAAQVVLSRYEISNPAGLAPDVTILGQRVLNKVDVIGWEVVSAANTVGNARPIVTMAFDLLKPYLLRAPGESGLTVPILRA